MTTEEAQDAPTDASHRLAVAGQVERSVSRPVPERERSCEHGCNGCECCTDYEDNT